MPEFKSAILVTVIIGWNIFFYCFVYRLAMRYWLLVMLNNWLRFDDERGKQYDASEMMKPTKENYYGFKWPKDSDFKVKESD